MTGFEKLIIIIITTTKIYSYITLLNSVTKCVTKTKESQSNKKQNKRQKLNWKKVRTIY